MDVRQNFDDQQIRESTFLSNASRLTKEHAFLEGSQASSVFPSGKSDVWMELGMEHCWNGTDRGTLKYSEKHLSRCHFVDHISHMDWLGIDRGSPR